MIQSEDTPNRTLRGPRVLQKFPKRTPRMPINVVVPTRKFVPPTSPTAPYVYPPPKPPIERKGSKTELFINDELSTDNNTDDEQPVQRKKLPPRPPPKKSVPVIVDSTDDEDENDKKFGELTRRKSVHDITISDEEEENDNDDDEMFRELTRRKSVHDITISDDDDDEEEEDEEEEDDPTHKESIHSHTTPDVNPLPPLPKSNAHNLPPIPAISAPGYSSDEDDLPLIPTMCIPGDFDDDKPVTSAKKIDPIYNSIYFGIRCHGCNDPLSGQAMTTSNKKWHTRCFKCQTCRQNLEHIAFYEKDGLPYCALDYHEQFSPRCDFCHTPVEEHSISALGKVYHAGHFFCRECGKPFDEETDFLEHEGHAYCEKDYFKRFGKTCKGCEETITDGFLVALGGEWHKDCFVCADCGATFASSTFLIKGGKPYCEDHYHNKKAKALPTIKALPTPVPLDEKMCHKCDKPIQGRFVSAFGHDYHPLHFQCLTCNKLLQARRQGNLTTRTKKVTMEGLVVNM
ncbi:hypothetical protein MFLAVUS_006343 [Mucor flavus]|uniref:Uncharacterized protein n=1 Tax=Mucor flavus TaxID=439312 RepID=A0ABP9Z196_9FUNG